MPTTRGRDRAVAPHERHWPTQVRMRAAHVATSHPLTPATNTTAPIRRRLSDFFRGLSATPSAIRHGIPNSRSEIAICGHRTVAPVWSCRASSDPSTSPDRPEAMSTELGMRNVAFEVDDLQAAVDRVGADGNGLVGGIGHEDKIADGLRARTRRDHRVDSRADRLTPPSTARPVAHAGAAAAGFRAFSGTRFGTPSRR